MISSLTSAIASYTCRCVSVHDPNADLSAPASLSANLGIRLSWHQAILALRILCTTTKHYGEENNNCHQRSLQTPAPLLPAQIVLAASPLRSNWSLRAQKSDDSHLHLHSRWLPCRLDKLYRPDTLEIDETSPRCNHCSSPFSKFENCPHLRLAVVLVGKLVDVISSTLVLERLKFCSPETELSSSSEFAPSTRRWKPLWRYTTPWTIIVQCDFGRVFTSLCLLLVVIKVIIPWLGYSLGQSLRCGRDFLFLLVHYNKTLDITSADESIIVTHEDLMSNSDGWPIIVISPILTRYFAPVSISLTNHDRQGIAFRAR